VPELHLVALDYAHGPRTLGMARQLAPGAAPLLSISDEGEVTCAGLGQADAPLRLRRELRRPASLVELIEGEDADSRWQAARLLLAAWEQVRRGGFDRKADQWTQTLLLLLQARASLRTFAAAPEAAHEPWHERAALDLLDAAAALEFFDPRRLAPFLQWLVAVLRRDQARALLDEVLPVELPRFLGRLAEPAHDELARIVEAVARAQRRQYFLGRYDLAGAGRLRPLLARLRFPRSRTAAAAWRRWLAFVDVLVPRLFAGCLVGILPFFLTDEAWRFASDLSRPQLAGVAAGAAGAVLGYLAYDRHQADPAGLSPLSGVIRVWLTGLVESYLLAAGVQWLASPSFLGMACRFNASVFVASAAFALAVGVFTQLIWQEKAVTAPP
jgi:hypothetical protein